MVLWHFLANMCACEIGMYYKGHKLNIVNFDHEKIIQFDATNHFNVDEDTELGICGESNCSTYAKSQVNVYIVVTSFNFCHALAHKTIIIYDCMSAF